MLGRVRLRRRPADGRDISDPATGAEASDGGSPDTGDDVAEKGEIKVVSVEDVREWLRGLGLEEYENVFLTNEINGNLLLGLTSENLREDLGITNLRHRRDLGLAIQRLAESSAPGKDSDSLPEHGRILDHLSNTRTVHAWMRLGIQMLAFSVITLRLAPVHRSLALVTAASLYFALVGIIVLLYGILRYAAVVNMIEGSGAKTPKFNPDRSGIFVVLVLVLIAGVLSLVIILWRSG